MTTDFSPSTRPTRSARVHRSLVLLLLVLVAGVGIGVWRWHLRKQPVYDASQLRVQVIDCDLLMQDGACYPLPKDKHRIQILSAPPGPMEVTLDGDRNRRAEEIIIDERQPQRRLFRITLPPKDATYQLVLSTNGVRVSVPLRTFVPQVPAWLFGLWQSRHQTNGPRNIDQEISLLQSTTSTLDGRNAMASSLQLSLLARALYAKGALGSTAQEIARDHERIIQSFRNAILSAKQAQLVSEQNENVLWLSEFLSKQAGRLSEAEDLMQTYRAAFAKDPRKGSYYHRQRAIHLGLRQKRSAALTELEMALALAQQIDDQTAALDAVMAAADVLIEQGRIETAAQWVTDKWKIKTQGTSQLPDDEGCRTHELWRTKLRIARAAMERDPRRALPKQIESPDVLWNAFVTSATLCQQKIWHAEMLLDWIQIQLLRSRSEDRLSTLRALVQQQSALLQEPWAQSAKHHLLGLIALQSGALNEAQAHFLALRQGRAGLADVASWQAEVGLAEVAASQATDSGISEALRHHENAEDWVEFATLSLPLGMGQASFSGQFERGTARHLQLLWKQGRLKDAWQLLRRTRTRGLRTLAMLTALEQDNRTWSALVAKLTELRGQLEDKISMRAAAAINQQPLQETEISLAFDRLTHAIHESLSSTPFQPTIAQYPATGSRRGEVMIACHPMVEQWLCLAQFNHELSATTLRNEDVEAAAHGDSVLSSSAQRLSEQLLRPFSRQIESAQRVTFLTYGPLKQVDLQLLPFGLQGLPLHEQKQVIFASDIPSHRIQSDEVIEDFHVNMNPSQYFFLNQELSSVRRNLTRFQHAARRLNTAYRTNVSSTWSTRALRSLGLPISPERITRQLFSQEAERADVLFLLTHAGGVAADAPERYLDLGSPERFYVSDILLLPSAPKWVALVGCGTAQADAEWSNVDSLGLAQSFLWKGSRWVLGTERTVDAELGARVAVAFYEELASARDPFQALRFALHHAGVAPSDARHDPTHDLGSFRLYAP